MVSKNEALFVRIFLSFLEEFGEEWVYHQQEFEKHVSQGCQIFGLDEEDFYEWMSRVIWNFIRLYVGLDFVEETI